jgi:ABC-2 type transport system ATP-binding protein
VETAVAVAVALVAAVALRAFWTWRRRTKRREAESEQRQPAFPQGNASQRHPAPGGAAPPVANLPPGIPAVEVSNASKSFRGNMAVNNVSFVVNGGEVFGMVGPNGAGKTTTIRMLMDIIKPDAGEITIMGDRVSEATKNRIGYLPEERGLYRKITVADTLAYLAALKDVNRARAKARAEELLQQVNMLEQRKKKIEELSRGMGQIIQFIATVLHEPDLLVLDEPFSGLDPVNTEVLKDFIRELKGQGKSIILSTHMMNQVEELCDRFLMINKGEAVLYGSLEEIRSRFRDNSIIVECDRLPPDLPGVTGAEDHGKYVELFLDGQTPPKRVLRALVDSGATVDRFEVSTPSLHEIFIQVARAGQ